MPGIDDIPIEPDQKRRSPRPSEWISVFISMLALGTSLVSLRQSNVAQQVDRQFQEEANRPILHSQRVTSSQPTPASITFTINVSNDGNLTATVHEGTIRLSSVYKPITPSGCKDFIDRPYSKSLSADIPKGPNSISVTMVFPAICDGVDVYAEADTTLIYTSPTSDQPRWSPGTTDIHYTIRQQSH